MLQADEIWDKMIQQGLIVKSDTSRKPNSKIYLVFEPQRNKAFGITEPILPRTWNIAFTSLGKLKSFMNNLYSIGILHSKQYRAFPTTIGEYFNRLKAKLGDFDLAIDPPDDFKITDTSLFKQ